MPQETKSHPYSAEQAAAGGVGVVHENLEGWIPSLATAEEIRSAFEKAFDYRGDVMLTLKDGAKVEGYIFDRRSDGKTLADCKVRLFPKTEDKKVSIAYSDVARVEFTGKDTAAGRSFETWVKKYAAKKAAGETNIGLEPEKLD